MCSDVVWERNPAYWCVWDEDKGHFSRLCENALDCAALLSLECRLSLKPNESLKGADSGIDVACFCDLDFEKEEESLSALERVIYQLAGFDGKKLSFLLDVEFLKLCDSVSDIISEYIYSNRDSVFQSLETTSESSGSSLCSLTADDSDDVASISSDIIAWKEELYLSALDDVDYLLVNYNEPQQQKVKKESNFFLHFPHKYSSK